MMYQETPKHFEDQWVAKICCIIPQIGEHTEQECLNIMEHDWLLCYDTITPLCLYLL